MGTSNSVDQKNLIGLLNNTILLPCQIDENIQLDNYLKNNKNINTNILANGDLPLEKLVNNLNINSLPNIRIHFEFSSKNSEIKWDLGECNIESDFFENSSNSIRQLLMFNFGLTKDSLDCFISYKKNCFNKNNILELKNNLETILNIYLEDNNPSIYEILNKLEIKTEYNDIYKTKLDKRLLAYKMGGSYPNVNYYDFKEKLDQLSKAPIDNIKSNLN